VTCRRPARYTRNSAAGHPEWIQTRAGSYLALELGDGFGGGIVECGTGRPLWVPYVEVSEIAEATARARELGASVLLEPRATRPVPRGDACFLADEQSWRTHCGVRSLLSRTNLSTRPARGA
jgi:hypothetical protein